MFYPDLITGRPLLNGRSGTFLIRAIVCPGSVRILLRSLWVPAFHYPPGREHKGNATDCILFCNLIRKIWTKHHHTSHAQFPLAK